MKIPASSILTIGFLRSAKGTDACPETGKRIRCPWRGTPSAQPGGGVVRGSMVAVPVLRGFLNRRSTFQLTLSFCFALFFQSASADEAWKTIRPPDGPSPTGQVITATAAPGAVYQLLNAPLADYPDYRAGFGSTTVTSPDGNTMLVLTSGFNTIFDASGNINQKDSNQYVLVYDISQHTPTQKQVLTIPFAFQGVAFHPNGQAFYVSGGIDDDVHTFVQENGQWTETQPPIPLGHKEALGIGNVPIAAGLAVTSDGTRLLVANEQNDSVTVIDLRSRAVTAELDLRPGKNNPALAGVAGGEYPYWIATIGEQAYISSLRDREVVQLQLEGTAKPQIVSRIAVRGNPNRMVANRAGTRLYVGTDNSDLVSVIDTQTNTVIEEIKTNAPNGSYAGQNLEPGSMPNSLILSPDEQTLYVTNGGANCLAVIRLGEGVTSSSTVLGLVPTGRYPTSVSVSSDGAEIYVLNAKSTDAGPNPDSVGVFQTYLFEERINPGNAANQYLFQFLKGGLLSFPNPTEPDLKSLTQQVFRNNHVFRTKPSQALMAQLHSQIKHVIYVVKENRTYDQILGDLDRGNGDPILAEFGQTITPNHHKLATNFVTLDNFYESSETSGDGYSWTVAGRTTDALERGNNVCAAGAFPFEFFGPNRSINVGLDSLQERLTANPATPDDPDLLPGAHNYLAPDSSTGDEGKGYIWDAALRAGLTVRNYGYYVDGTRYLFTLNKVSTPGPYTPEEEENQIPLLTNPASSGTQVAYPTVPALNPFTDPYYRGFDTRLPDYFRYKEWEREFDQFAASGNLPNLEVVYLPQDHTGSPAEAIYGVNTAETQVADNDWALGLLVGKVAHSPFKDSTLIFVVEDDAQDGPDHVDAYRAPGFVVGPYVRQGAVVSERYTMVDMLRTIEDILGVEHLSLETAHARPMAEVFDVTQKTWNYTAEVSDYLRSTQLPVPPSSSARVLHPKHDALWWARQTKGMDFSEDDRLDTIRYNRILWYGVMGDRPYPTERTGQDLRFNRNQLIEQANDRSALPASGQRTY